MRTDVTGRISPSLPHQQTQIDVTGRVVPSLPHWKTRTNVTGRFSLPAMSTNANQCDGKGHPLLVMSIHMEPVVQTHTGFGTCVTCEYPYPHLPKPISMSMGTGFRQVWVQVLVELPMGYPWQALSIIATVSKIYRSLTNMAWHTTIVYLKANCPYHSVL